MLQPMATHLAVWLGDVKVAQRVSDPVVILTVGEVLAGMGTS